MYSTVIVPLDGSAFAEYAIPIAALIVTRIAARLELIRVHDTQPHLEFRRAEWNEYLRADEASYLERLADERLSAARADVRWSLIDGSSAAVAISAYAESSADSLIVMSTHGRTGIQRSLLGSVADGVARHASVPLLLLRPRGRPVGQDGSPFTDVVAALDGSALAERVLPHAMAVASAFGVPLLLFRVVTTAKASLAHEYVKAVAAMCEAHQPRLEIRTDVEVAAEAGRTILARALQLERPLLALGSHGRGLSRFVMGSVADDVLRGAADAVLMIRGPIRISPTTHRQTPTTDVSEAPVP